METTMDEKIVEAFAGQIAGIVQIQNVMIHALHRSGALDKKEIAEALEHVGDLLEKDASEHAAHPVKFLAKALSGQVSSYTFFGDEDK